MWDRELTQQCSLEQAHLSHALYRHFWQGNFHAPIQQSLAVSGAYVIDVGCSSEASWLLDMASEYPVSRFVGVDRINESLTSLTNNVEFRQCDVLNGIPFPDGTFEYTHMTKMLAQFTETEWNTVVIPELVRITASRGWIELVEPECKYSNEGPTTSQMTDALNQALSLRGINASLATELVRMLNNTGSVHNIQHTVRSIPLSRRGSGGLEDIARDHVKVTLQRARNLLLPELGTTVDEYDMLVNTVLQEIDDYNTCITSHRVYCQKSP